MIREVKAACGAMGILWGGVLIVAYAQGHLHGMRLALAISAVSCLLSDALIVTGGSK